MYPVLFEVGNLSIYSYGFLIAVGAICGVWYMAVQGRKEVGLTFDQANSLFLFIFIAAFVGGKVFLFFEDPSGYLSNPLKLIRGRGFVFYGSFLFAVPVMLWFFKKHKLHVRKMLDVMAVTTCLVHIFGRLGCFMAGCCHGTPTDSFLGVIYTDPACSADPLGVSLHATQLYEAGFILLVLLFLLRLKGSRKFYGQLFVTYLIAYAIGRFGIEFFRGDMERGVVFNMISHSQIISLLILASSTLLYTKWKRTPIDKKERFKQASV